MDRAQLTVPETIQKFVLAGNATITIVSKKTQARYTFKVERAEQDESKGPWRRPHTRPWFVALLSGPDNESDYQYLGTIMTRHWGSVFEYRHGRKSRVGTNAPSATAAAWFFRQLFARGPMLDQVEVWHEGRCGRCGRKLTVPESVSTGFGPECAGRMSSHNQL